MKGTPTLCMAHVISRQWSDTGPPESFLFAKISCLADEEI